MDLRKYALRYWSDPNILGSQHTKFWHRGPRIKLTRPSPAFHSGSRSMVDMFWIRLLKMATEVSS
jgi:hypothetical protein